MAIPEAISHGIATFIGAGLPLAIAIMGITYPILHSEQADIAKISVRLDDLNQEMIKLSDKFDKLNSHLTETESDPSKIVAKALGVSVDKANAGTLAIIDGKAVISPKTNVAKEQLEKSGYVAVEITPGISGYTKLGIQ